MKVDQVYVKSSSDFKVQIQLSLMQLSPYPKPIKDSFYWISRQEQLICNGQDNSNIPKLFWTLDSGCFCDEVIYQ